MKRVVITGATGAIGVALVQECIHIGWEVYAIVRPDSKRNNNIPTHERVHLVPCDLSALHKICCARKDDGNDAETDESLHIPGCDIFYHLGWAGTIGPGRDDMPLQLTNVQYTLDAVELAGRLGCTCFVGVGSQAEYGRVEGRLSAQTPTNPEMGYGIAKLCAGQMSRVLCAKKGIRHIWARVLSVYGPYDGPLTMISSTIRKILSGEAPQMTQGEQQWDYLYSGDAARALRLLGERGVDGRSYCLGSGRTRPLAEYVRKLHEAAVEHVMSGETIPSCTDENAIQEFAQRTKPQFGAIPYAPKQVMYLCADIEELTADTGFVPEIAFEEGIRRTVEWMEKQQ